MIWTPRPERTDAPAACRAQGTSCEAAAIPAEERIVVSVRPRKAAARRCGRCGKRCAGYDQGEGRRRWRALDLGTIRAFLEADSPRVRCAEHGVVAAQVPWARPGAGHTYAFDAGENRVLLKPVDSALSTQPLRPGRSASLVLATEWLVPARPSHRLRRVESEVQPVDCAEGGSSGSQKQAAGGDDEGCGFNPCMGTDQRGYKG